MTIPLGAELETIGDTGSLLHPPQIYHSRFQFQDRLKTIDKPIKGEAWSHQIEMGVRKINKSGRIGNMNEWRVDAVGPQFINNRSEEIELMGGEFGVTFSNGEVGEDSPQAEPWGLKDPPDPIGSEVGGESGPGHSGIDLDMDFKLAIFLAELSKPLNHCRFGKGWNEVIFKNEWDEVEGERTENEDRFIDTALA